MAGTLRPELRSAINDVTHGVQHSVHDGQLHLYWGEVIALSDAEAGALSAAFDVIEDRRLASLDDVPDHPVPEVVPDVDDEPRWDWSTTEQDLIDKVKELELQLAAVNAQIEAGEAKSTEVANEVDDLVAHLRENSPEIPVDDEGDGDADVAIDPFEDQQKLAVMLAAEQAAIAKTLAPVVEEDEWGGRAVYTNWKEWAKDPFREVREMRT
jgi:hypothetical protein